MLILRRAAQIATAALTLTLISAPALAAPTALAYPCGKVTAYTPPTATAAGSITLGTNTFVLAAGPAPTPAPPVAVGSLLCLSGERDASGAFLLRTTLVGDTVCGNVAQSTPASASSAGGLTFSTQLSILVAPGVTFTPAQLSGTQCFRFGFNAQGNAQVTGFVGAAPGSLPSTSTAPSSGGSFVLISAAALAIAATAGLLVRSGMRR